MADEFIAPSIDQHPLDQVIWGAPLAAIATLRLGTLWHGAIPPRSGLSAQPLMHHVKAFDRWSRSSHRKSALRSLRSMK